MTKNEQRQFNIARKLVAVAMPDAAVRIISIVHRSARRRATQAAALELAIELGLADRVAMFNGCLAHVDDVPAVRS
jgi:hypothetical protein